MKRYRSPVEMERLRIPPGAKVRDAMRSLEDSHFGITLVVDSGRRLIDTITDGDVRRYVLAGKSIDASISVLLQSKSGATPKTLPDGTLELQFAACMREHDIRQIPVIGGDGTVVDVVLMSDLVASEPDIDAVVMAGGFGKRLAPLTDSVPKPMLRVGEKPILEHIVGQLRTVGIRNVRMTTHYRADMIKSHFGDGADFGVAIDYVDESEPQGTAGALRALRDGDRPLFVMNGDILTRMDIRAMLTAHQERKAQLTVGVRRYDLTVPYGVLETQDDWVRGVTEKPNLNFMINAGIYLVEPAALRLIPDSGRFDMTDLIQAMLANGTPVASFPVYESWIDVGKPADFAKAQAEYGTGDAE